MKIKSITSWKKCEHFGFMKWLCLWAKNEILAFASILCWDNLSRKIRNIFKKIETQVEEEREKGEETESRDSEWIHAINE